METSNKSKEPVRLRRRATPSGLVSLYLDIYVDGKRRYEYLRMYLVPEQTRADKEKNRQTLLLAESIRAKRVVELRNGEYGFKQTGRAKQVRFFDYFDRLVEKHRRDYSVCSYKAWCSSLSHLHRYEPHADITFADVTPDWVQGFREYLDHGHRAIGKDGAELSPNTKADYWGKLKTCLRQAVTDGILDRNPMQGVEAFRREAGKRMYLTLEEVRRLAATPCRSVAVKTAFLFSCFTGLRRSDIIKMRWSEVHEQGELTRIIFQQHKTRQLEYLDITPQAAELLGERGKPDDYVFADIRSVIVTNAVVKEWVARAGIEKDITFHCARHTFATLMLSLGTDLYTVSKLLGHTNINTTQIYAKVMDEAKRTAVMNIPRILPDDMQ